MSLAADIDPVALYAAVLSTLTAIVGFIKWLRSGPSVSVTILNPLEVRRFGQKHIELIISNNSSAPVVAREARVSFYKRRRFGVPLGEAEFNHRSTWDPSLESVPHHNKPNMSTDRPAVIRAGDERHQLLQPFREYDPKLHWLKAVVTLRNSKRKFVAWAPPMGRLA